MEQERKKQSFWLTPNGLAAIALIGAVTYFLLTEHLAHTIAYLPFAILLLCPVMHLFMHGGHGHGHGDQHGQGDSSEHEHNGDHDAR